MNHCDFHYSHLLPKKPGILPLEETMKKQCRRCGAEFVTRSRIRKRCDACQTVVSAEKQKKANERLKARRRRPPDVPAGQLAAWQENSSSDRRQTAPSRSRLRTRSGVANWRAVNSRTGRLTGRKTASKLREFRQITGGKTAGATAVFHGIPRAGSPSQQRRKTPRSCGIPANHRRQDRRRYRSYFAERSVRPPLRPSNSGMAAVRCIQKKMSR